MKDARGLECLWGVALVLVVLGASCSSPSYAPLVLNTTGSDGLEPDSSLPPPPGTPGSSLARPDDDEDGGAREEGTTNWSLTLPVEEAVGPGPGWSLGPAQQQYDPDAGYRAEFFARSGVYLSGRYHWSSLGGDFDGDTLLASGSDVISIPDADEGYGYEAALGWMSEGWAMELSYTDITYEGSIGTQSSDIDYYAITWNGMKYLRANEPVQPYFMIGLLFSWAELEDASTDGAVTGDAELEYGFGFDGAVGLAWWLENNLALDVRALFVYQEFDEADGVSASGTIDDPIEGPSYGVSVGLTWVIGKTGK